MEINLLDIDEIINKFVENYHKGIVSIHRNNFNNSDNLSVKAFIEEIKEDLKTGCITFINKNNSLDELYPYLFYIVNSCCKKLSNISYKKYIEYICPGCLFFNKINLLSLERNNLLSCDECKESVLYEKDPKKIVFFNNFISHNKSGVKCPDCKRFIPKSNNIISCPYLDCCFSGDYNKLGGMHHPNSKTNIERLILDKNSFKEKIKSDNIDQYTKLEIEEDLQNKISLIKGVIETQSSSVAYTENRSTTHHKLLVYKAIDNLLDKYKISMVNYLLNNSRTGGFQHKIFQEYIRLLEKSFPYFYRKGGKIYKVESLLDPKLNIFDGISSFEGVVNNNLEIKNGTKEIYIGSKKSAYVKPYYIGKILNIIDENNICLMDKIKEYSFLKIKMRDIKPGAICFIKHLRVVPHFQLGSMSIINRIRKKIVDRIEK